MAKYDPKLLKKISQSQLISAAVEMDIKNADRISKEMLINAFLEKVEAADTDGETLSNSVILMYNTIGEVFELLTEPTQEESPKEEVEEVPEETQEEEATEEEVGEEETEEVQEEASEPEEEEFVETPPEEEPEVEPVKEVKKVMVAPKKVVAAAVAPPVAPVAAASKKPILAPKVPGPIKPMPTAAPAKKAPAPPKKTSKNRFFCAGEAIKSKKFSGTVQALIQLSDEIHVKSGGKTNLKEATAVARMSLNVLCGLGSLKVEGDKFTPVVAG